MTLSNIKAEICALLGIDYINASEAKNLKEANGILGSWSKTENWRILLNTLRANSSLEASTTEQTSDNIETTVQTSETSTLVIQPVLKADSFIDFVLSNKVWLYKQYQVTDIKFPTNNKAVLFSGLVNSYFTITKKDNYELAFNTVNQVMEEITELFSFDWLQLANYYHDLTEQQLIKPDSSQKVNYKSIKLTKEVNKANTTILNLSNFKQSINVDMLGGNLKTFKEWTRVISLELPETKLELFLTGLKRNYAPETLDAVKNAFKVNTKVIGKMIKHNANIGAFNHSYDPHIDIKDRVQERRSVLLTRGEDRYTKIIDTYTTIKISELFKILDVEIDMTSYLKHPEYCGYWKLLVISTLLDRMTLKLTTEWGLLIASHLKVNTSGYIVVDELDSKRFNNKFRMNNNVSFTPPVDSKGDKTSKYLEHNQVKIIDRVEVSHSNMIKSSSKSKSMKKCNRGGTSANYVKLAETNTHELRLFYVDQDSVSIPHKSFKDPLARVVYVEKNTSISYEIGIVWIKETKSKNQVLFFQCNKANKLQQALSNEKLNRQILETRNHITRLQSKIKDLRAENDSSNTNQLKGLLTEKLRYEQEITAYDLQLPIDIVLSLYHIGVNLLTGEIVSRNLKWQQIFNYLKLEIPDSKDNAILVLQ